MTQRDGVPEWPAIASTEDLFTGTWTATTFHALTGVLQAQSTTQTGAEEKLRVRVSLSSAEQMRFS